MTAAYIVLVTAPSRKEADHIAQVLVEEKLAACVSIIPEIYSRYWWQGRIENGEELLLMIKTLPKRFKSLSKRIKELHSYTVPEILALPVAEGSKAYLEWMNESLASQRVSKKASK